MAKPGERKDIEADLRYIVLGILRGKAAAKSRAVHWYKLNKVSSLFATTLGSAGISPALLSVFQPGGRTASLVEVLRAFHGIPIVLALAGAIVYLVLLFGKHFYASEEFEKKAIQSLALFEAFARLEAELIAILSKPEPIAEISAIYYHVASLAKDNVMIMPPAADVETEAVRYLTNLVQSYAGQWNSSPPHVAENRIVGV